MTAPLRSEARAEHRRPNGLPGIDALDLQDITMVVHDVGGPIGFMVATGRPERFGALVITNSFCWPLSPRSNGGTEASTCWSTTPAVTRCASSVR